MDRLSFSGISCYGIIWNWFIVERSRSKVKVKVDYYLRFNLSWPGNFASNCHRDFKLGSCFCLWKPAPNLTCELDLWPWPQFTQVVKSDETYQSGISCQNTVGDSGQCIIYCWKVYVKGQSQAKGQIHLIGSNFASKCHKTSNLVHILAYENLHQIWLWPWPLTLTLKSSPTVKIFETYQLRKTSQNMLGYYVEGIIYCWWGQRSRSCKRSNSLN